MSYGVKLHKWYLANPSTTLDRAEWAEDRDLAHRFNSRREAEDLRAKYRDEGQTGQHYSVVFLEPNDVDLGALANVLSLAMHMVPAGETPRQAVCTMSAVIANSDLDQGARDLLRVLACMACRVYP